MSSIELFGFSTKPEIQLGLTWLGLALNRFDFRFMPPNCAEEDTAGVHPSQVHRSLRSRRGE